LVGTISPLIDLKTARRKLINFYLITAIGSFQEKLETLKRDIQNKFIFFQKKKIK